MRKAFSAIFFLLIASMVFADVGPSPTFEFTISNMDSYSSQYSFFYRGNIWDDHFFEIADNTHVYKLNTEIQIFAIPVSIVEQIPSLGAYPPSDLSESELKLVLDNSLISEKFNLPTGSSTYTISTLDASNNVLFLELTQNIPDTTYGFEWILFLFGPILIPLIIVVIILFLWTLKKKAKK